MKPRQSPVSLEWRILGLLSGKLWSRQMLSQVFISTCTFSAQRLQSAQQLAPGQGLCSDLESIYRKGCLCFHSLTQQILMGGLPGAGVAPDAAVAVVTAPVMTD